MSALDWFSKRFHEKPFFTGFWTWGGGIALSAILIWQIGRPGDLGDWVILTMLSVGACCVSGLVMWEFFGKAFSELRDEPAERIGSESLPRAEAPMVTTPQDAFDFTAHYDEGGARNAERLFYRRSLRELRFWPTVLPPAFFGAVVLVCLTVGAVGWFTALFAAVLLCTMVAPFFFYMARPRAAAALARKYPERRIRLRADGLIMTIDAVETTIPWSRVSRLWNFENYVALVVSPFFAAQLPVSSLPAGALEFIERRVHQR